MNVIGASLPITLDGLNRQLHSIGLKINKATSSSSTLGNRFFSNNNSNNNNNSKKEEPLTSSISSTLSSKKDSSSSTTNEKFFESNTKGIDIQAIHSALQDSDALITQVRKACEDFTEGEPTVLQLEAAVWIQRAKIEHIAGRFRQASASYENACKCLLQVETRRAPIFSTQDALNQAINCILYACGELVLSEQVSPSTGQTSITVSGASTTGFSSTISNNNGQQHPGFLFGSTNEQRQNFSIFSASNQHDDGNDNNNGNSSNDNTNRNDNSKQNSSSSSNNNNNKSSIGSRISSWFKGLPSIQPANSPAAAVAAEEQEALRKQREAEKLAKARREAVWRWLPLDAPHRFPASQRICPLLRFMARELLKFDSIDLASHFAELSARYCLDYRFQFSFYSNLYQASAMKRKLEIVAPPAPNAPSPTPKGFVAIPVSLCQLFDSSPSSSSAATEADSTPTSSTTPFASPIIEFCSVSSIHPTFRQQFTESMLQVCSTSLILRQYERSRISGTFALFCLENNREENFSYSVPNDHVNIAFYNLTNNQNFNFMSNESFTASGGGGGSGNNSFSSSSNNNSFNNNNNNSSSNANVPTTSSSTAHFVTVATMNSNLSEEVKCDENCAMIGLSIVLGVFGSRPFPNFHNIAMSHVEWWNNTFVAPFFEEGDDDDDDDENSCKYSEFFSWRKPVAEGLKEFVNAVTNMRNNNNNGEEGDTKIFIACDKLKTIVSERNQLLGLCIHRLYHEVYSKKAEAAIVGNVVECVAMESEKNKDKEGSSSSGEERAPSPKLDDHVVVTSPAAK